ncbi:hypothetical protein CRUP_033962 [Coryphaenoides rupestris]|nr:hypothetical protein CRUP_033962 [Coryphaenoides rupestris]
MFTITLSWQNQRDLAANLTKFLSKYKYISDSYIIEFFTEELWEKLPASWREALCGLSFPQHCGHYRYPSVWPLSLLAFRATAHALSFPRRAGQQSGAGDPAEDFLENHSQSSMLGHIFRKHVKPKKQHEIRKLGTLVKQLCDQTNCEAVVDVGSGQGHLTRFLSFGLGLSVTAIEADRKLVTMATKFDESSYWTLEKEKHRWNGSSHLCVAGPSPHHVVRLGPTLLYGWPRVPVAHTGKPSESQCPHMRGITSVACCYMKITTRECPKPPGPGGGPHCSSAPRDPLTHPSWLPPTMGTATLAAAQANLGYPMSAWVQGLPGHGLSYKAREGACHAIEDYMQRLREESRLLRTHCYRATLETLITEAKPEMRRVGVQTIKKAHLLPFAEYAHLGLARVGLPASLPLEPAGRVEAMLEQEGRVVVYFSLALLLAPAVETLVLLDRIIYLQENGVKSTLVPLFDPELSPRNFVLVAMKTGMVEQQK